MNEKRNLGRGLGDLMEEVSSVRAMPAQPVADAPAAVEPAKVVEERPSDAEIARQHEAPPPEAPARVEEKIVRQPFVPLWAKVAIGTLVCFVAALCVALALLRASAEALRADMKTKGEELMATQAQLADAQAALKADPLAWTADLRLKGLRVERDGRLARIVFDNPFFTTNARWAPGTEQLLFDLLARIAPHTDASYLTIVGHTARQPLPPRSGYKDNYDLALKRAEAVMEQMVRIVRWPPSSISARSDGDKYPPYAGTDLLSQVRNRTITIEIRPRS